MLTWIWDAEMEKRRSSLQQAKEGSRQAKDSVSRAEREKGSESLAGKKRKKKKRPEAKEKLGDGPAVKEMSPVLLRLIPSELCITRHNLHAQVALLLS